MAPPETKPRAVNLVTVVVPVYDNARSLPLLFSELLAVEQTLATMNLRLEMIFVDDGSGDASFQALLEIKKQRDDVRIIKLTRNFGAIQALKTSLPYVTGDCFLFLAADLQDPPVLIVELAKRWQQGKPYIVCMRERRDDPLVSRMFASLYYRLLRLFVVPEYPIGGFDLALMDRSFLPYMRQIGKNININLFAYWLGFAPDVVHYVRRKREHGRSRWTFSKKIKLLLDSFLGFSIVPIRLISLIGLGVSLISIGYGSIVAISALMGGTTVPGFATLAALISFLLGLIIIMLGVIGEYLWRIADETNRRPESVIEKVY